MDKIRRILFTISAESVSHFEWVIWTIILSFLLGTPIITVILQSFVKGIIVVILTSTVLFAGTLGFVGLADIILSVWPFEISDEEKEYEEKYVPRIPMD